MTAIALLVFGIACIYALWRALPFSNTQRHGWSGVWRLACVIATVRISIFGSGALLMRYADWRQGVGYVLVLVGLPEIYAAKTFRFQAMDWVVLCCVLLTASSVIWAALFRLPYRTRIAKADERPN
jgi:hypothetical protein